jgi:porin
LYGVAHSDEPAKYIGVVHEETDAPQPVDATAPDPVAAMLASLDNCIWQRPKLGGSLCGLRYCLAENGVLFDADLVQVYQGVSSGGLNTAFKYGGHADYVLNVDMDKAAGLKGLFFKMRTETLFGEALGFGDTATILPPSLITKPRSPTSCSRSSSRNRSACSSARWTRSTATRTRSRTGAARTSS